jgi:hypothetical protein
MTEEQKEVLKRIEKTIADIGDRVEKNVIDIAAVKEKVEILYTEKP